jgi:hypothetical protein
MKINIKKFLEEAGVVEAFYPGKRIILPCRQSGEFKSHCVVLDWRNPDKIRLEVKAGLSGKDLEPKQLKKYPVSLQNPTYVEIEIINDNSEDEGDSEEGKATGSASGGKGLVKKKGLDGLGLGLMAQAFGNVVEGKTPDFGKIVEMVVIGTKIAAEAFANVMEKIAHQIAHAKISTTELLAQAGKFLTKVKPPAFMAPKGDETADYKYDREKNADIGFRHSLG